MHKSHRLKPVPVKSSKQIAPLFERGLEKNNAVFACPHFDVAVKAIKKFISLGSQKREEA